MLRYSFYLFACLLLITACKKEEQLLPTNKDENYLVVKDDPSNPTDHAIYQFYQNTGIPCFYNDTISSKQVGDSAGIPRYFHTRLALAYSPASGIDPSIGFVLPQNKQSVIPMLNMLKNDLLPLIPQSIQIHSILFVDSLTTVPVIILPDQPATVPLNAYSGFNTMAIRIVNPDTMTTEVKKQYIASILGAICFKKLTGNSSINLTTSFYSISRQAFMSEIYVTDFSFGNPDPSKTPEDYGIIYYYTYYDFILTPSEQEDLHSFLRELFNYSTAEFISKYEAYPVTLEKFNVIKNMAKNIGFQFPD